MGTMEDRGMEGGETVVQPITDSKEFVGTCLPWARYWTGTEQSKVERAPVMEKGEEVL